MTKRKEHPRKRGRKHLARGVREQVYLRWRAHFRERRAEDPKRTKEQMGKEFVDRNRPWFLELGIFISDYPTLRNVLVAGVVDRRARRRASWRIVTNVIGRRFFSSNALLVQHAHEQQLLGNSEGSGGSLIHAFRRRTDPN